MWLECGGKSPNIILADCPDLDRAAATAAGAIFFNQGEMCTAASRLIIEESVRDQVLEKVVAASRTMPPGDPLDPVLISRRGYLSEDERLAADLAKQSERPLVGDELENAVQKLIAKALEIVMLYPAAVTPARQNRLWTLQYELEQGLAALPED